MEKILLVYGPEKGSTEQVAKKIIELLGNEHIEIKSSNVVTPEELKNHKYLILGSSTIGRDTWETKHTDMGWDKLVHQLDEIDFTGKVVALFGLGNQIFYPDHFVDMMGLIGKKIISKGAKIVGQTSTEGYEFNASEAEVVRGKFVGLAIDEDNFSERTDEMVIKWIGEIKGEFGL